MRTKVYYHKLRCDFCKDVLILELDHKKFLEKDLPEGWGCEYELDRCPKCVHEANMKRWPEFYKARENIGGHQ